MDYEEKYKQAFERARYYHSKDYMLINSAIENIFPELKEKESEDERIRKAIHIYLDWLDGRKDYAPKGVYSIKDMIAWVEKQGDKKPTENVQELDADNVIEWLKDTINETTKNYGVYKETHLTLPYNSIEDLINDFKEDFGL